MEALELRNRQQREYIDALERDLAERTTEQVYLSPIFNIAIATNGKDLFLT